MDNKERTELVAWLRRRLRETEEEFDTAKGERAATHAFGRECAFNQVLNRLGEEA